MQLGLQISACKGAHSTDKAATRLVSALRAYSVLATTLAAWDPVRASPATTEYVTKLRTADTKWRDALKTLGKSTSTDLLSGLPKLLLPTPR
ncbi:MAG: hypothetical protein QOC66_2195 [Pseudonocardiales bacterium]|jgi:hypothetical protein|nr:hypothetical protein [Pseudonocardiales bacterium]